MDALPTAALSTSQRPVLGDDESVAQLQSGVGVYLRDQRQAEYDSGSLYLTAYRLVWVETPGNGAITTALRSFQVPLAAVLRVETQGALLMSHAKITLHIAVDGLQAASAPQTPNSNNTTAVAHKWCCSICSHFNIFAPNTVHKCTECGVITSNADLQITCAVCTFINGRGVLEQCEVCATKFTSTLADVPHTVKSVADNIVLKFSFRNGGQSHFHQRLQEALSLQAWTKPVNSNQVSSMPDERPAVVGVSGLIRAAELSQQRVDSSLGQAFQDLDSLMKKASEMVTLAASIAAKLEREASGGEQDATQAREFQGYLTNLGISNPVTRDIAGNSYSIELARELSDFLEPHLQKSSGILSLTDIYCLYNRARGVALISPEDLHKACLEFERARLPVRLRCFDSGLLAVVRLDKFDESAIETRMLACLKDMQCITPAQLADMEKLSFAIATAELQAAEMRGVLCRDETVEGVWYYENLIAPPCK